MVKKSMTKEVRLHNVAKTVCSTNDTGKTGQPHVKNMKLDYSLTPYTKISSKWIQDLQVGLDNIKLLEENIGRTLSEINHSKIVYDPPPRIMKIKEKVNKWDLMQL